MVNALKYMLFFVFFCCLLGCQVRSVLLDKELPDEEYLPKSFGQNIIKSKYIFYKYSDSLSTILKDKPQEYVFEIFENEKKYTSLGAVENWVVFNYKKGIQELIKRITNTKEVGLEGSYNLVINYRVENGDMLLEPGEVIDDDLFRVYGRANYLLKEITGEDFGSADLYSSDKELLKLQRKWIRWYNRLCQKN
ncbi:MAG: hypothetical protein ACK4FS_02495 [Flavobacterium sp.]